MSREQKRISPSHIDGFFVCVFFVWLVLVLLHQGKNTEQKLMRGRNADYTNCSI